MRSAIIVVSALIAAGCNGLLGIPEPDLVLGDAGPDGGGGDTFAVRVTQNYYAHLGDGTTTTLPGFLGDLTAYRPMENGYSEPIPGTGADGNWFIHGIPPGEQYYLNVDAWQSSNSGAEGGYIVTAARSLDLSTDGWGRVDTVAAPNGTRIVFDVFGMSPWQEGDVLAVLVLNVSAYWLESTDGLEIGAVDLRDLTFNWSEHPLLFRSAGDRLKLHHLRYRDVSGVGPVRTIVDEFQAAPLEQIGGTASNVAGEFVQLPINTSTSLDWRASEFRAAVGLLGEPANPSFFGSLRVDATQPFGGIPLLELSFNPDTDFESGPIEYANPFPSVVDPIRCVEAAFGVPYNVPGAPKAIYYDFNHRLFMAERASEPSSDRRPMVHAPTDIRINGNLLDREPPEASTSVSLDEPIVISWQPHPETLNHPSYYRLQIVELRYVDEKTYPATTVLAAETPETEFTVRPGLLEPDRFYHLVLTSRYAPEAEPSAPWRQTVPVAEASTPSGLFTTFDP